MELKKMVLLDCNKCGKRNFFTVDSRHNVVRIFTKKGDYVYFFCHQCLIDFKKTMDMVSEELRIEDLNYDGV